MANQLQKAKGRLKIQSLVVQTSPINLHTKKSHSASNLPAPHFLDARDVKLSLSLCLSITRNLTSPFLCRKKINHTSSLNIVI